MYDEDLAYIHHEGFGDFARSAGTQLLKLFRRHHIREGLVVDLGCGSGIWAAKLVEAGYDVFGVDISGQMVKLAKESLPQGRFLCSSFFDVDIPPCRVVTSLGECFCYLFDEKNDSAALEDLFGRVYESLDSGGLFVFDVVTPQVRQSAKTYKSFWESDDWSILVEYFAENKKNVWRRGITTFRKMGELYRRSYEEHEQKLYKSSYLARPLRKMGFKVRVVRRFGDYSLLPGRVGFICRKG